MADKPCRILQASTATVYAAHLACTNYLLTFYQIQFILRLVYKLVNLRLKKNQSSYITRPTVQLHEHKAQTSET